MARSKRFLNLLRFSVLKSQVHCQDINPIHASPDSEKAAFWGHISGSAPPSDDVLGHRDEILAETLEIVEKNEAANKKRSSSDSELVSKESKQKQRDLISESETAIRLDIHDTFVPVHSVVLDYLKTASEKLVMANHITFQHTKTASDQGEKQLSSTPVEETQQAFNPDGSINLGSLGASTTTGSNTDSASEISSDSSLNAGSVSDFYSESHKTLISGLSPETRKKHTAEKNKRLELISPLMKLASDNLGDVLTLCREAREAASKVVKFDLYENNLLLGKDWNKYNHPYKVPEALKERAKVLEDFAGEIRSGYMKMVMGFAKAIIQDHGGKKSTDNHTVPLKVEKLESEKEQAAAVEAAV